MMLYAVCLFTQHHRNYKSIRVQRRSRFTNTITRQLNTLSQVILMLKNHRKLTLSKIYQHLHTQQGSK